MVSDLKCPECNAAVHPCSIDTHTRKCLNITKEKLLTLLSELYILTKITSFWSDCDMPGKEDLENRIKNALKL